MKSESRDRILKILEKLTVERAKYFDKHEKLNSEGLKLLKIVIREVLRTNPSMGKAVRKVLRSRTYESIITLYERLRED
ncbi:MAG: hypothetical protein QXT23_00970 [Acidilobaceae archaeon]